MPGLVIPVIPVLWAFGLTMVALTGPLSWVQVPVPTMGLLAAMVAVPGLVQAFCAGPALALVGTPTATTFTSLVLAGHGLLLMVQRNTKVPAVVSPLMVVVGEEADTMEAVTGPLTWLQEPVPMLGAFAAMDTVPTEVQTDCAEPAFAVVGGAFTVMVTLLWLAVQGGLLMVQRST